MSAKSPAPWFFPSMPEPDLLRNLVIRPPAQQHAAGTCTAPHLAIADTAAAAPQILQWTPPKVKALIIVASSLSFIGKSIRRKMILR